MSRSNPHENTTPNPAVRWFEWDGENGVVRYYDKELKQQIQVGSDFTFMLLDQLGSVRGWHDASKSGIYSNEVKDTRAEVMVVRAFKGGTLAEGVYRDIKDRVNSVGGKFVANCYIAFKGADGGLDLASIRFKGAALGAWMEFSKANRADLYKKAIRINGYAEGKKGRIVFRVPVLSVKEISEQTNAAATAVDVVLQDFLAGYLKRNKREQAESTGRHVSDEEYIDDAPPADAITDDDIPF